MAASIPAVDPSTATTGSHIRTVVRASSRAATASDPGETPFRCGYQRLADENPL